MSDRRFEIRGGDIWQRINADGTQEFRYVDHVMPRRGVSYRTSYTARYGSLTTRRWFSAWARTATLVFRRPAPRPDPKPRDTEFVHIEQAEGMWRVYVWSTGGLTPGQANRLEDEIRTRRYWAQKRNAEHSKKGKTR